MCVCVCGCGCGCVCEWVCLSDFLVGVLVERIRTISDLSDRKSIKRKFESISLGGVHK